ncbi:MAG: polyprenyl synthetase family protein [Bacteroidales bacterium]|nr:polyprenyl synthetase family protein [Porphyromonas sp.]MDD6935285.1 polyprenyl synthetase family protein [Bacteroidales bacterium]MDY3102238.1 polyprenyl synthetase family protein [Porphyromonas sp.]
MNVIEQIARPIADYRLAFEDEYAKAFVAESPMVAQSIEKIAATRGKHIRPILVGLVASLQGKSPNAQTVSCAVLLEMLHAASLIHDDVIDQATLRRGKPTLNAFYDNHAAVLVGDYILSIAFLRAIETGGTELMRTVANVGKQLSEGELLQIQVATERIIDEKNYYSVIEKKTATLFEACAALGMYSVNAAPEDLFKAVQLGKHLGIAFQLRDDIFDYVPGAEVGKPVGNDLKEGKITLPLIYLYNQAEPDRKVHIESLLDQVETDEKAIAELIRMVRQSEGINYAQKRLEEELAKALEILRSFPNSPANESLVLLTEYLGKRTS